MARKNNLQMTPIMSLAVLAIFAMMIPMFTTVNNNSVRSSKAASVATPSATATPEAVDVMMEY